MRKWLLVGIFTSLLLTGCGDSEQIGFSSKNLQQNWVLTNIDGKEITIKEPRVIPNMAIDSDLKVSGFGGCNRFFGQAELKDNKFKIDTLSSTKMACIQDDQATTESVMTISLQEWNSIALENDVLTLTSEQHILTFMPEDFLEDSDQ